MSESEREKTMAVIEKRRREKWCVIKVKVTVMSHIIKNMTDPFATRLSLMVQHYVKLKHLMKKTELLCSDQCHCQASKC